MLLKLERQFSALLRIARSHIQTRRSRLLVPESELAQISTTGLLHSNDKFFDGHRLSIMALKIQVGSLPKHLTAEHTVQHTDNFGTLFIDGNGVKVIYLHIGVRLNRVRHRPTILGKLMGA